MVSLRWVCFESEKPSLTAIPEAVIRDKIVSFLDEETAFKARGICMLFSTAYFNQTYKGPNGTRIFGMLHLGYRYEKLKRLSPKWYSVPDLSSLRGAPSLVEFSLSVNNLVFENIPDNLIYLKILHLPYCSLKNIHPLSRLPALTDLDLNGN